MNLPRIGVGPMSREIVASLCEYSNVREKPLMLIASRNQVDFSDGYSCITKDLVEMVRETGQNILICRDHCGPYFKDSDRGLSLDDAMERALLTMSTDISLGFDLIHIDTSRVDRDHLENSKRLIEHALSLNPEIMIEYGSEENLGGSCQLALLEKDLRFLWPYRKNVRFVVAQTGSLTKDRQVGRFDPRLVSDITSMVHDHGFLFKEHNADYLTEEDLKLRCDAGVDAVNIAPQIGTEMSRAVKTVCENHGNLETWNLFCQEVRRGGKWERWVTDDVDDDHIGIVAGHYHQSSTLFSSMIDEHRDEYQRILRDSVFKIMDLYSKGLP